MNMNELNQASPFMQNPQSAIMVNCDHCDDGGNCMRGTDSRGRPASCPECLEKSKKDPKGMNYGVFFSSWIVRCRFCHGYKKFLVYPDGTRVVLKD